MLGVITLLYAAGSFLSLFFTMCCTRHNFQLFKAARHEVVDVLVSDVSVASFRIAPTFCKLDETH